MNFDFCCSQVLRGRDLDPCTRSRRDASVLGHSKLCRKLGGHTQRKKWWWKENQEPRGGLQLKQGNFSSLWPAYTFVMYALWMIDHVWIIRWMI